MNGSIYTIGHSNHSIEKFISLLRNHEVAALADVRSQPYSRHYPQYSQKALKATLNQNGIFYVFLGKELGARSENPTCYHQGKVQFDLLAKEPLFVQGLERLKHGMQKHRIAIMCAEKDPLNCHRAILVSRRIHEGGIQVEHIHADGRLESHTKLESRMLKALKMSETDLFRSYDEILTEAYQMHGQNIAYQDDNMNQGQN